MYKAYNAYFMARDWAAMSQTIAEDVWNEDRRRVANGGIQRGRDAVLTNMRAVAEVGVRTSSCPSSRPVGERLAWNRQRVSGDPGRRPLAPRCWSSSKLTLTTGSSGVSRSTSMTSTQLSPNSMLVTWPATRPRTRVRVGHRRPLRGVQPRGIRAYWAIVSHRRRSLYASGDLAPAIRGSRDVTPNLSIRIETVHAVSAFGAVVTNMARATSNDGFDAEWRMVEIFGVEDGQVTRLEIFDEADLDAALARFDDLAPSAPRRKTRQAKVTNASRRSSQSATGRPLQNCWLPTLSLTIFDGS